MAADMLRVVLVSTRNPLNIGAAARAMSNFGFSKLRVVSPFPAAFREARSAVGASAVLKDAEEFPSVAAAVADCELVAGTTAVGPRELLHPVRSPEEGSQILRQRMVNQPCALLFGSEKRGLSKEDLSHCHWLIRIPTREEHRSMNLGQAVAICLYELARTKASADLGSAVAPGRGSTPEISAAKADAQGADAQTLERLTKTLFEALLAGSYIKPGAEKSTREKMRRLVRRMNLSPQDAETWTGALSKMTLAMMRKRSGSGG